jgi:hypothetical protein
MGGGVEERKRLFAEPGSTAKMVLTGHAFVVDKIWIGGICAKRELRLYTE